MKKLVITALAVVMFLGVLVVNSFAVSVANYAVYTVSEGDSLWLIAKKAGQPGESYKVIVNFNPMIFSCLYTANGERVALPWASHRLERLIYPNEKLLVPKEWAGALGLEQAAQVKPKAAAVTTTAALEIPGSNGQLSHVIALLAVIAGILAVAWFAWAFRPWKFFQPAASGPAMVPGGVNTAQEAIETIAKHAAENILKNPAIAATIPKPFSIKRLWEIKLYGLLEVSYANGVVGQKMATGQTAYLAELSDNSQHILLQRCGNDVRISGNINRLVDGHWKIIREIDLTGFNTVILAPEVQPAEPVEAIVISTAKQEPMIAVEETTVTTSTKKRSFLYPFVPTAVGARIKKSKNAVHKKRHKK